MNELRLAAGSDLEKLKRLVEPNWWNGEEFPQFSNPADVALRVLSINYPKREIDNLKIKSFVDFYNGKMKGDDKEFADSIKLEDVVIKKRPKSSCCLQFKAICRRNRSSISRNPIVFKARVGQNVALGVITALVFMDAGTKCQERDYLSTVGSDPAATMKAGGPQIVNFDSDIDSCEPTIKNMKNLAGAMFFMCVTQFMGPFMMTTTTF